MFSFNKILKDIKKDTKKKPKKTEEDYKLSRHLDKNVDFLKNIFHYPINQDFVVRELQIQALQKKAVLFFIDGIVDENIIENVIIHSLTEDDTTSKDLDGLLQDVVSMKNTKRLKKINEVKDDLLNGFTAVFIEGYDEALSFVTMKFEHRNVDKPTRENVIRGSQEGFIGSAEVNRSLIRKRLRNENLITENMVVGQRSKAIVNILYLSDLVNMEALEECKNRLKKINTDSVQSIEILEQFIEDKPYSLLPSILYTERPDRANAFLLEGHTVLLMDSSSACLILPITFWALFHTADDMSNRWAATIFMRIIRLLGILASLFTAALYIAISKFHPEMIPTDLLLSITATREMVPFPAVVEVLLMVFAFELINEAGIRIPTAIGPTIGIVGALIIGQAAVQANIVSPILIIIVGITGLSSFSIPDASLNNAVRIYRLVLFVLGSILGMYGIALGVMFMICYMVSYTSFGIPFFSPLSPYRKSSGDIVTRHAIIKQFLRPFNIHPQDNIRQQKKEGSDNKDEPE